MELTKHFTNIPLNMKIEHSSLEKAKFIPKIISGGLAVVLSMSVLTSCVSAYNNENEDKLSEEKTEQFIGTSDSNKIQKSIVVDTFDQGTIFNYLYIYDMKYLDKAFEPQNISLDDFYVVINNNNNISSEYKDLIYKYCQSVSSIYPNVELRVFYENLKTLKVIKYTKEQLMQKLGNENFEGTYSTLDNAIYVLDDNEYIEGNWDYQVLFHELSHCLRNGLYNIDGKDVHVCFEGENFSNVITTEALNSLFAVSLFNNGSNQIGYQLQSNYFNIFLECMNNYDLSDYINHSQSYFAKKLDECNGNDNYSTVILDLIQMQYDDYYSEEIEVAQEEYYPIYDYISNMYFNKYITHDMSYQDAYDVACQLVIQIINGVPENYNIDISRFYINLDNYCKKIGISQTSKQR